MTMAQFYSFFRVMVHTLDLTDFNIKAYSVRSVGATWEFQYHNCLPRTLERGRWQHAKTARVYLTEGLMAWQSSSMTKKTLSQLKRLARRGIRSVADHDLTVKN